MEGNYKQKLVSARSLSRLAKNPSPAGLAKIGVSEFKNNLSLMKHLNPMLDWMFGIALIIALLKDILDFVGIGSLPVIGTVVTFCVSVSIGLIMFIAGSSGKKGIAKGSLKRFGVLGGGTFVEMFFGINSLPIETIVVIMVFYMTLRDRAQSEQSTKEQATKNQEASQVNYA